MSVPEDDLPTPARPPRAARLPALGAVALLLAAVAVPHLFHLVVAGPPTSLPYHGPPLKPSPAKQFRGICIQLPSWDPKRPYEQFVREIARTGANTICISVAAHQENAASSVLFVEARRVPSAERVEKLIRLANQLGLSVVFMPIVLLENPGSGEWRGLINPKDRKAWWKSYASYILFYAKLAQRAGAKVFMVGSELVSMEDDTAQWKDLIKQVRGAFKGMLCYSANWDHYENIRYWADLDIVGMTTYHDLVGEKKPTLEVLMASWKPIKKKILTWQKKVNRPIMFTEVGWPSQVGCAKEPWNYFGSTTPDLPTQAKCFDAFFRTWRAEKTICGALIWEWRNWPGQVGGPKDIGYLPIGKPAMGVIRNFFTSPGPWPTTGAATRSATRPASVPTTAPATKRR